MWVSFSLHAGVPAWGVMSSLLVPAGFLFNSVLILLGSKALKTGAACMGEAGEPEQSIPAAQSLIFEASWFFGGLTHGAGMRWAGSPGPAPWWRGRAAVSSSPAHSPSPLLPNRWAGSGHMFAELGVFRVFFFFFPFFLCYLLFHKGAAFLIVVGLGQLDGSQQGTSEVRGVVGGEGKARASPKIKREPGWERLGEAMLEKEEKGREARII